MKLPEGLFESLPGWHKISKLVARKILKILGNFSGVAISVAEIIGDKKLKSAWLVLISKI